MPQPMVVLRAIRSDDAHQVATLLTALGYPSDDRSVASRIKRLCASSDLGLVAVQGEFVIGMASVHLLTLLTEDAPMAKLSSLVVAPEARGQGVGRSLVHRAMAEARQRGCARMTLTTHLRRSGAHMFYERLGFEFTGRRYVIDL